MLKKIGIIVSLMGINCIGMQDSKVIEFHLDEATPIHHLLPNSISNNHEESYWVDFPGGPMLEVIKNYETNIVKGFLIKNNVQKAIAYPESIYEFLKKEWIWRSYTINKFDSKLVAFLTTKNPSDIVRGPISKNTAPNVHLYEAHYLDDGVTITSNKKDVKDPKVTCSDDELNNIKKKQLQVNITNASVYRCFISRENENVQELGPLASRFVYNFLQEKYKEVKLFRLCGAPLKKRTIDPVQLSRVRTFTIK